MTLRRAWLTISLALPLLVAGATLGMAAAGVVGAEGSAQVASESRGGIDRGLLAIGAGLAIGLAGLGTGIAQSRIGAAGVGAIVEKPESLGVVIILLAIPETVVILGFVVAAIILFI